ncbi:hypothetical protein D3C80_1115800 [compost metagenome]
MGGVGVEVLLRQAHLVQVFTGRTAAHDGVGRGEVIGGDVVRQHRQRPHALEGTFPRQRPFPLFIPIRRATDIGAHGTPVVQRRDLGAMVFLYGEHGDIDLAELLRLHRGPDHGIYLVIRRPDVFQANFLTVHHSQHILLYVEADGARDGIGHHQRRRGEEGLLGVRVDATVEVAVARQHGGGVEIAIDDFLLDGGIQRT